MGYAWREYVMYVGGAFGAQMGNAYDIASTNPTPQSESLEFGVGLGVAGYIGYSLGDYAIIEAELSFFANKSAYKYFSPDIPFSVYSTPPGSVPNRGSSNSTNNNNTGESLQFYSFMVNGHCTLDTGNDFIPYAGVGFGLLGANWSGFRAGTMASQFFVGGDLLLIPKASVNVQITVVNGGNLEFETRHVVPLTDDSGNPVADITGVPIYTSKPFHDTIKTLSSVRIAMGLRIPF